MKATVDPGFSRPSKRLGHAERAQRVDLELPPDRVEIERAERVPLGDPGIVDQQIEDRACVREPPGEALYGLVRGHVDAGLDPDGERPQLLRIAQAGGQ